MTLRQWGAALGVSYVTARTLKAEGMPEDLEEARRWLELRNVNKRRARFLLRDDAVKPDEVEADNLEDSLPRIRRLEKALALAAERAFKENRTAEAISLRREHVGAIKALFESESRLIKINESRGRLISVDRALAMINEATQSAILILRRLPELGRDAEERRRLEAFMNAVLNELKAGAAEGLKHAA